MTNIAEALRRLTGASGQSLPALRSALAAVDADALQLAVSEAEAARRGALVGGRSAEIDETERRLSEAVRDRERGALLREELSTKIAEAEAAAEVAELDELARTTEVAAAEAAPLIAKRYAEASIAIAAALADLSSVEQRVAAANTRLVAAGRPAVLGAEERAFPTPIGNYPGVAGVRELTSLRPVGRAAGYGAAAAMLAALGPVPRTEGAER